MISIQANLKNPFSKRWDIIKVWSGALPITNKYWEIQIDKVADIVSVDFRWTIRQDHAGIFFCVGLFGFEAIINIYDARHWDHKNNTWENYTDA